MKIDIQQVKLRYKIIGRSERLDRAIEIALQVASTDMSVLISGESGVGKENFPKIIHDNSPRKHAQYIAVNCGAIPEGTIDSELFGHEKGSFTGALADRKGYFEVADGGTIFLDEVGELPLSTQARLLRILETGEFLKVGSSKVQTTNVRIVAATNIDIPQAIFQGRFREDLYYRLNTVPIQIPPLRERGDDVLLLFRKFANDFSEKYRMPGVSLTPDAQQMMISYRFPGNVRQLKNITEQISIIETQREINSGILKNYLPDQSRNALPMLFSSEGTASNKNFNSEREILYQILFDMRKDVTELKRLVHDLTNGNEVRQPAPAFVDSRPTGVVHTPAVVSSPIALSGSAGGYRNNYQEATEIEEALTLDETEAMAIRRALKKHNGRRNRAAKELNISERTLYRRIKDLNIED